MIFIFFSQMIFWKKNFLPCFLFAFALLLHDSTKPQETAVLVASHPAKKKTKKKKQDSCASDVSAALFAADEE